jgi:hypothetical protein
MNSTSTAKRPFGVWVIILLQLLSFGLLLLQLIIANPDFTLPGLPGLVDPIPLLLPLGLLGAFQATLLIGLWFLRRWAWFLLMIELGLSMAFQLLLYFNGSPPYFDMFLSVSTVFYLNLREVQQAFERPSPGQGAA